MDDPVDPVAYTLDTSAILAYFADEPGAQEVGRLLTRAEAGHLATYVSFMTEMEVLYRVWRGLGEQAGKAAYLRLKALPVRRLELSEPLMIAAARIKATHELSVADAWIAATAVTTASTLVHKDPEFRPLGGEVPLLELPFKAARGRARRR